ncbi:hypothetical protein HN859_02330, partial [Candidatus Parcubacteria bacterium]|nr:hypothetical protein [Candidatus Parcubacteria bacterium]
MEDTKNKNKKINSLSVSTLIIANLFPLGGVLFFGMDIVSVILLYWFESIVIGFFNVLKMIKIKGSLNSPYIPFFILQYVIFSSVHFYAILGILKLGWTTGEAQDIFLLISKYFNVIFFTLCTLIISHAFSFVSNFINKKEY